MRTAVIVGSEGQDGRLLWDLLAREGARLVGLGRGTARSSDGSWDYPVEISDPTAVGRLVATVQPDEIYYLAAHHHSSEQEQEPPLELFAKSEAVHVTGAVHFLEAIAQGAARARFFYAASKLIFGAPKAERVDESAPIDPDEVYGVTKAAGLFACRHYRRKRGVFASCGILFNHESPLRGPQFLSRKIVLAALAVKAGEKRALTLGDLDAEADWGFAPDYVEAMRLIARHGEPDDFVVATGQRHKVRDFAEAVFSRLGLDWKAHVEADAKVLALRRPAPAGDAAKLRGATGWKPSVDFGGMVEALLRAETAAR